MSHQELHEIVSNETAIFDDPAFISGRTALGLDELGLRIREVDWGDSDMELFMIKQLIGEIPAERHPPNRTVTIKLLATAEKGLSLAKVLYRLQQKLNTINKYNGWVKRVPDRSGGFKHNYGCMVYKTSVSGIGGWFMAHRQAVPEITLTMTCSPYFYSDTEITGSVITTTNGHEVEWEISEVQGTAPGLMRIELTNENTGTAGDWHAAVAAAESATHSSATTAKMKYLAEELTKLGTAEAGTRTGSAGTHTVKSKLGLKYQPLLGSKITASGQMSHIGARNLLVRAWDPNTGAGEVTLKLQWKALGSDYWSENEEIATTLVGNFGILDLGECRPEVAMLGNQVWEWRLLGKSDVVNQEIEIDIVYVLPTEQYLQIVFETESETFAPVILEDEMHTEGSTGTMKEKVPAVGGKYETFGDPSVIVYLKPFESPLGSSTLLKYGFERSTNADGAKFEEAAFGVSSSKFSGNQTFKSACYGFGQPTSLMFRTAGAFGFVLRFVDVKNWVALVANYVGAPSINSYRFTIYKSIAGTVTAIANTTSFEGVFGSSFAVSATLNESGVLTAQFELYYDTALIHTYSLSVTDATLVAGTGTLKEGKTGIFDYQPGTESADAQPRFYAGLLSTKPETEERGAVCYSGKKLELRTDGCFREGIAEAAWARLATTGFAPFAEPGGLEVKPLRGIVIPTRGDFEAKADSSSNSMGLKYRYRPAFLYTSGPE